MFCPTCGAEYNPNTRFCKSCGANLYPSSNMVEIHISKPPIAGMTWATVLLSVIGGMTSLGLLAWSLNGDFTGYREARLAIASSASFVFTCLVTLLLIRQIGRLISSYQEAIKQTIKREQVDPYSQGQVAPPQNQPSSISAIKESISSIIEKTTRSL